MRLLLLATNTSKYMHETLYYEQMAILAAFPGSVIYGPGFSYKTNDAREIVEMHGGENSFDAVICYAAERQLLGEPLDDIFINQYSIIPGRAVFPLHLKDISLPKICWINDFWHCSSQEWAQILFSHGFNYALATYAPPFSPPEVFSRFFPLEITERIPFIPWPRAMNSQIFTDYGKEKTFDVTMLGAQGSFYPLREQLLHAFKQSDLNFFHRQHPGYVFPEGNALTGVRYAQVINRSKIFASCTSKFHIPFIKLYEVLACRSALLCDRPRGAELLGLKDGETFIEAGASNCVQKAKQYLQEEDRLEFIWDAGRQLFLDRHTVEKRAQEMTEVLPYFLNTGEGIGWAAHSHNLKLVNIWNKKTRASALASASERDILSYGLPLRQVNWKYWLRLGLNLRPYENPPVVTQFPELVALRPELLYTLAKQIKARTLVEIGTARGLQSMVWAQYLVDEGIEDGRVITCDIISHDERCFKIPLEHEKLFTRRELWENIEPAENITFVHGDSDVLRQHLLHGIDIAYIDGKHTYEYVIKDFSNIFTLMNDGSIIIFDDCDARFPGVMRAVDEIAIKVNAPLELVSFYPSEYKLAIMQL